MLSTLASVNAATRYLDARNAHGRPVSHIFSDPGHGLALRAIRDGREARNQSRQDWSPLRRWAAGILKL